MSISEETLMAYADGELDQTSCAAVEEAMRVDPIIASKVQQHRDLRTAVFGAFAPVLEQAIPARIQTAAQQFAAETNNEAKPIIDLSAARLERELQRKTAGDQQAIIAANKAAKKAANSPRWSWPEWGALAATLIVGVMVGHSEFMQTPLSGGSGQQVAMLGKEGRLVAQGKLATALSEQLADASNAQVADKIALNSGVKIGVSFVANDGAYCRSFAIDGSEGLACRVGSEWNIPLILEQKNQQKTGDYRQASSGTSSVILDAIDQRISGQTLDRVAEQQAKKLGWKR